MSSGKVHTQRNLFSLYLIIIVFAARVLFGFFLNTNGNIDYNIIVVFSLGFLISTYALSPDLDLGHNQNLVYWGFLKKLWIPYAKFMKHRGISITDPRKWSHTPILGTLSRIVYLVLIAIIIELIITLVMFFLNLTARKYIASVPNEVINDLFIMFLQIDILIDISRFVLRYYEYSLVFFSGMCAGDIIHLLWDKVSTHTKVTVRKLRRPAKIKLYKNAY